MIDVVKPTLLLNQEKSVNNIKNILQNIKYSKINIRPHFKTHQSLEVGRWFKKLEYKKSQFPQSPWQNIFQISGTT